MMYNVQLLFAPPCETQHLKKIINTQNEISPTLHGFAPITLAFKEKARIKKDLKSSFQLKVFFHIAKKTKLQP